MNHWHRIGLVGPYFSIRRRGVSIGQINTFCHFTVLLHPTGAGRSKHAFAALSDESENFLSVLTNGKCGQDATMTLANHRGILRVKIGEEFERSIDFDITATSGLRRETKGSIFGAYAIQLKKSE